MVTRSTAEGVTAVEAATFDGLSSRSGSRHKNATTIRPLPPVFHLLFAVALCAFHVQADANNSTAGGTSGHDFEGGGDDFVGRFTSGTMTKLDMVLLVALGVLSMEAVNYTALLSGAWMKFNPIPVRGKHLDDFSTTDKIFIAISKAQTGPFVYFLLRYALTEPNLLWRLDELSLKTVLLPIPVLFVVFDFFYTSLHWALHIKGIYGFIHKHHHTQKAPSRANDDAINVHPIEYVLGEYNHLWALYLCCRVFQMPIHMVGAFLFLSIGGVMAGWNHTRYDIVASVFGFTIYDSKAHDVHHRIPQSNYGQYIMFWDHVFGTYRAYDPNDRVNPKAQLDPKTGKSLEYTMAASTARKSD